MRCRLQRRFTDAMEEEMSKIGVTFTEVRNGLNTSTMAITDLTEMKPRK